MEHIFEDHKDGCPSEGHCMVCDGGLGVCTVCKCFEGSLATECPGIKVSAEWQNEIYKGRIDFRNERWVDIPSIHSPASYKVDYRNVECEKCPYGNFDHYVEGSPTAVYTCSLEEGFRPCEDPDA